MTELWSRTVIKFRSGQSWSRSHKVQVSTVKELYSHKVQVRTVKELYSHKVQVRTLKVLYSHKVQVRTESWSRTVIKFRSGQRVMEQYSHKVQVRAELQSSGQDTQGAVQS